MMTKAYACYSLNRKEREISSSGGIYPLIAGTVLDEGGAVYAACYKEDLSVAHRKIDRTEDLPLSQGSKYVASDLGSTFSEIETCLKSGRKVLFVGTPCQCAGLSSFLKERKLDRSKAVLMDFVCHGIPGKAAWRAYLESVRRSGQELTSVNMRDKSTGWSKGNFAWKQVFADGHSKITPHREVSYMHGFLKNLFLRPSCYTCAFKGITRCTDITLGDYWGIWNNLPEMDDNKGTSLVLIHSETGAALLDQIKGRIRLAETDIEWALQGNAALADSVKANPKREEFYSRLKRGEDFASVVEACSRTSFTDKVRKKIIRSLKSLLKR